MWVARLCYDRSPKPKQRPRPALLPATVDPSGPSDVASGLRPTAATPSSRALTQPVTAIQAYSLLPDRLGEYLGPACLSYCQERQDYEVSWGATETLAVYGRPLHSDRTTRLFLHDVDLEYAGFPDATRAPETPPMILEGMRHRARLQDQAGEALRQAAASGASGDGTPPLAFTPDGDVSDFMERYLYKGERGDSAWIVSSCKSGISPAWLPHDPPIPHVLPVGPLLWVFDFGQLVAVPALGHPGVHLFPWSSAPAHHKPPPLVPTLSVFNLCHRSVAAASQRLLVRRCCRLVSPPSIIAPTSLWVSRTASRVVCWYVPLLLRCQRFQLHPWSQARRFPTRRGYRKHRCGHPPSAAVYCRRGCFPFLLHRWPTVLRYVPSHLWAHVTLPLFAPLQLLDDLFLVLSYSVVELSLPLLALIRWAHWLRPALTHQHTHFLSCPLGTSTMLGQTVSHSHSTPSLPHLGGPPGPKSRDHSAPAGRRLHRLVLSLMITPGRAVIDARVPASARDAGGAASASGWHMQSAAKPTGNSVATCGSLFLDQTTRLRKRSFKRAIARAARAGGAVYRGRWRTAQQLGVSAATSEGQPVFTTTQHRRHPKHAPPDARPPPGSLKILTWNAGGLGGRTGALFDELLIYANTHPFDVLFIQESKWTFSSLWEDPRWIFIHSGSMARDFKQGGVLVMIARRVVDSGSLRLVEPLPGRLLWVHFLHKSRPVDLLNFYQHTWKGSERVAQLRHRALDILTKNGSICLDAQRSRYCR